jgi:hypothetical protein
MLTKSTKPGTSIESYAYLKTGKRVGGTPTKLAKQKGLRLAAPLTQEIAACYLLPAACSCRALGHLPCFQAPAAQSLWTKKATPVESYG